MAEDLTGGNHSSSEYDEIPEHILEAIKRYVVQGIRPGHFLSAVICNNLKGACCHADSNSQRNLCLIVRYFYNMVPGCCWGSEARFEAWTSLPSEMTVVERVDATWAILAEAQK